MTDVSTYIANVFKTQLKLVNSLLCDNFTDEEIRIHNTRKAIKRFRAYLNLVRPALPDSVYRKTNKQLRGITKMLAVYRRSTVNLKTVIKYRVQLVQVLNQSFYFELLHVLTKEKDAVYKQIKESPNGFYLAKSQLKNINLEELQLELANVNESILVKTLNKNEKEFSNGVSKSRKSENPEVDHDWRKALKRILYQLEICESKVDFTPKIPYQNLDEIGDLLGESHDIAELIACLKQRDFFNKDKYSLEKVLGILEMEMLKSRKMALLKTEVFACLFG